MKAHITFDLIDTADVPAATTAVGNHKESPFDPLIAEAAKDFDKSLKIAVSSPKEYARFRGALKRAAKRLKVQVAFSKDQNYLYLTAIPPKASPQPAKLNPAPKKASAA